MKQTNFQFHAKRSEIMVYLYDLAKNNSIQLIGVNIFPQFSTQIICLDDDVENVKLYDLVILSKNAELIKSDNYNSFMKAQKGNLIITLGADNEQELIESSMGVISDGEIDASWKKIIADFKKRLLKGAWVINPNNKAKSYMKDHRYSLEAQKAYYRGVKICAFAGICIYELNDK